jgi:hypothetical protein
MQAIEYIKKSAQEVHDRHDRLGSDPDDERYAYTQTQTPPPPGPGGYQRLYHMM